MELGSKICSIFKHQMCSFQGLERHDDNKMHNDL